MSFKYTRDQLLEYRPGRPLIPRSTRKTLFTFGLWRPRHARVHTPRQHVRGRARSADSSVPYQPCQRRQHQRRQVNRQLSLATLNVCSMRNKSATLTDILVSRDLDVFALTESWHEQEGDLAVRMSCPTGYKSLDVPRSSSAIGRRKKRGGGVVLLYKDGITAKRLKFANAPSTFELLGASMTCAGSTFIVVVIYRPGGESVDNQFYDELTDVLEQLSTYSCPVVITGDLNLHLDVSDGRDACRFHELLDAFGMHQSVAMPTHRDGHTLDVVVTRSDLSLPTVDVRPSNEFSDHSLILFQLPLPRPPLQYVDVSTRAWKKFDGENFRADLLDSQLCVLPESVKSASVDELMDVYDCTMSTLLDKYAPRRVVRKRHQPATPWFDSDCAAAKRKARMFERRYRRTRSNADRREWIREVRLKQRLYAKKQNSFWEDKIANSQGKPQKLWANLSAVLRRQKTTPPAAHGLDAETFSSAFAAKVDGVHSSTAGASPPSFVDSVLESPFDSFSQVDVTTVQRLISQAANKTCELDPVPTWVVKKFATELSPFLTVLINASYRDGVFPSTQKCAVVTPVLKKATLDPSDPSNYRPISNLTFVSKLLERCTYKQLTEYLQRHNLLPEQQSAYRPCHSTETAMLKVLGDAYVAADSGQVTLLGLLDLSAAFDTVDHGILIERLRRTYCIRGHVINWITSYLTGRTQYVRFGGDTSTVTTVQRGVPQGSVLGPILFLLYVSDVISIVQKCGFTPHAYADDLQVYGHTDLAQSSELLARMAECITRVEAWMASNRLCLNAAKTEVIWLGSSRRLVGCTALPLTLPGVSIQPSPTVRDLGVMVDGNLSMDAQVCQATSVCFFYLRQLRLVRPSLTDDAAHALVRAVIHGRLDYCNGLFAGLSGSQFTRLQSVLRAAARLVLRLPGRAPVSDVMRDTLHWLSYPQRVTYKLCVLTYKCLHDLAPPYLSRCCTPLTTVPGRSQLRSADDKKLFVPRTRTVTFGPRAFYCAGPSAWNDLPSSLRQQELSLAVFRQKLKTALFLNELV